MKNILITGAAGFIGRELYEKIKVKNKVYCVDDLSVKPVIKPQKKLIKKKVQQISSSFLKRKNIDIVIHLAAKKNVHTSFYKINDPVENFDMTFRLLNQCNKAGIKKVYVASTCEIFGFQNKKLSENEVFDPFSPYAVTKVASEYLLNVYRKINPKMKITSLIFFNTYGPSEGADAVIPNFVKNSINKNKITIEGSGQQARDFTYISDTIKVLEKIILSKKHFNKINIGSNKSEKVLNIAKKLKKIFPKLKIIYDKKRPNEIKNFICKNDLIKKEFNFRATYSLDMGLKKVIEFYSQKK